ncbi:MAG TPA: hypothetical protein VIM92_12220, partial [Rhodanobacteraceae bacterium]
MLEGCGGADHRYISSGAAAGVILRCDNAHVLVVPIKCHDGSITRTRSDARACEQSAARTGAARAPDAGGRWPRSHALRRLGEKWTVHRFLEAAAALLATMWLAL